MISIKKFVSNEMLQLALLLSLIRNRNDNLINNFEYESPTVGVGGRNNGLDDWNQTNVLIQHNTIHPKSIDNYQEDLIRELNSLGRYNRIDYSTDVTAYLLNVDGASNDLPSIGENSTGHLASQPSQSSTTDGNADLEDGDSANAAAKVTELSKEDMAIIELLWKEDAEASLDLLTADVKLEDITVNEEVFLSGASNSNDTDPDPSSAITLQAFEDPTRMVKIEPNPDWAFSKSPNQKKEGTYICPSSSQSICGNDFDEKMNLDDFFIGDFDDFNEKKLFTFENDEDFLFSGIKNEFKEEKDSDFLVADEAPHELFSFPKDEFLIHNALQLCELNDCCAQGASNNFSSTTSQFKEEKEEIEKFDFELDLLYEMMQTAQYHPARPYHQGRVPYVRSALGLPPSDQRWQEFASNFMTDQNASYPHHHPHPHVGHHLHHNYAPNMTTYHHPHHHDTASAIIHNATLPPPIGDLNNTSPYHLGASPNLGSVVTSSMNLTNCDNEATMANSTSAHYKLDHDPVYYQHNVSSQSLTNQNETYFPSMLNDDDLQLMDMAMNESMYGSMLDNVTSNASNNMTTTLVPAEKCTDSDSAVSSMGSERVPSLSSDNEWMETNSDSGHTPGDHYSAEYSKYRWYENYMYPHRTHSMGSDHSGSHRIPPSAQKKYQLYGKRLFHDHNSTVPSTSSDLSGVEPAVPNIKYEMNDTDPRLMEPSCSSSLMKSFSPSEIKYSSSSEFTRPSVHRPLSDLVSHNHSYTLPPEALGATSRHYNKDKTTRYIEKLRMVDIAVRKSEEEQLTRDEKKARAMNIPIDVNDIINLPMDEFNERLSKYDLTEAQLTLIRDIRRRGKNKVAAQNCRKRKLDQIISLADEVKQMKDKKRHLLQDHEYLSQESVRIKNQFSQLYKHVFNALRDSEGNPYSPYEFTLEQTSNGNVELVRRHQHNTHSSSSNKESSSSSMDSHHYRSKPKDYHDHRKDLP